MLPFSARGRSACCSSVSAAVVMIMPGVQKPHWNPCAARNAAWTGWPPRLLVRGGKALDRRDLPAERPDGGVDAAVHRDPVDVHRARAAVAGVAALLDAVPAPARAGTSAGTGRAAARRHRIAVDPHPASSPRASAIEAPGHGRAPGRVAVHVVEVRRGSRVQRGQGLGRARRGGEAELDRARRRCRDGDDGLPAGVAAGDDQDRGPADGGQRQLPEGGPGLEGGRRQPDVREQLAGAQLVACRRR